MLLEIGKKRCHCESSLFYADEWAGTFELTIDNTGMIVSNNRDYTLCALDRLDPPVLKQGRAKEDEGKTPYCHRIRPTEVWLKSKEISRSEETVLPARQH